MAPKLLLVGGGKMGSALLTGLLAQGEGHADQVGVPLQQVLPRRLDVRLGSGHELRLVAEGPLAQGQPDRDELLFVPTETQVPTWGSRQRIAARLAIDRHQRAPGRQLAAGPRVDERADRLTLLGAEDAAPLVGHEHSTSRPTVSSSSISRSRWAALAQVYRRARRTDPVLRRSANSGSARIWRTQPAKASGEGSSTR